MNIGPQKRTVGEIKGQLLDARRAYKEGKEKLYENSVMSLEGKSNPWLAVLFLAILAATWCAAIFGDIRLESLWDQYRFLPIIVLFFVSYFTFFFLSKLLVKPSLEEVQDDTSYIAVFSACERREHRGLISAGFAVLHTAIFIGYLIAKETHGEGLPLLS